MADVNVNFLHPTDGRVITVSLDDSITAQEAVAELITADFITPDTQGYNLAVSGGRMIEPGKSFRDAGIEDNTKIRVLPATDAGIK
jgi:hypothetical protein